MCKLRQITHKVSKAQRAYVKFVSDLPEFTYILIKSTKIISHSL